MSTSTPVALPVAVGEHRPTSVTIAPGWQFQAWKLTGSTEMRIDTPGIAPESTDPADTMFPGGLTYTVEHADPLDDLDVAKSIVTALAVAGMHEGIEWVRVAGQQIANPHPIDEEHMWAWMRARLGQVLDDYLALYPSEGVQP